MEYSMKRNAGRLEYSLSGQLTFSDASQFEKVLAPLRETGVAGADFDVRNLEFIDSTGMSLFVHAYDAATAGGYEIGIRNAQDRVKKALDRAGFGKLVTLG